MLIFIDLLKLSFSVDLLSLYLKRYIRNNKIFSSNTQINETLTIKNNNRRNTINSNQKVKLLKLQEKSDDIFIHRNSWFYNYNFILYNSINLFVSDKFCHI